MKGGLVFNFSNVFGIFWAKCLLYSDMSQFLAKYTSFCNFGQIFIIFYWFFVIELIIELSFFFSAVISACDFLETCSAVLDPRLGQLAISSCRFLFAIAPLLTLSMMKLVMFLEFLIVCWIFKSHYLSYMFLGCSCWLLTVLSLSLLIVSALRCLYRILPVAWLVDF